MWSDKELKLIRKHNYNRIRELYRIAFGLGVNLTAPSRGKDSLKILNVVLVVSSIIAMYGHWSYVVLYKDDLSKSGESFCCALQTIISIVKMIYYLFVQHKFYMLLEKALTHEILQQIEVFHEDYHIKEPLKVEIEAIMDKCWRNIRRQLIFYICCCAGIIGHYFFVAVFMNLYHKLRETPNYQHILPFPSIYPIWNDHGMDFPYYHLQIYLEGAADYISGMCAVGYDGVFIVLSVHSAGLVEVFKTMVQLSTSPLIPKDKRVEYLRYCIFHQKRIYNYLDEIQAMYQHVSLPQFIMSLIVWGIVLFQMSIGLESDIFTLIRMIMYISAAGYEIVIYCLNGQYLSTASEGVPMAIYSCEWYDESMEFKKMIRMMIMRSNKGFQLNMSWFSTMSLPTLMSMIRTSGSYFLMLRNLSE